MTERQFLVDINPNIDLPEYNLVLYSLYEQPITELYNITNFNIKPFFIGIDEMSFNIPMTRNENDGQIVRNEIYDMVDGEYYIKLNDSKFFVINKINEKTNDDGFTYKEVSAYSREAELNQKRLVDYRASSRMLYDRENTILEDENGQLIERGILNYIFNHITNAWTVGTVDEKVVSLTNQGISRELNFSNSSLIQVFQELQKTYNCVFKFNTITQVIDVESAINYDLNVEDITNSPQYKGLYISDENFIKNMSKNIEYDKVKTRLFLYGKDNVSIQNVHPTGQPHIDNLSTFKTTKFMTQELIDGLNAYELLVKNANPNFTPLLNQLQVKNAELEELYNKDDVVLANKGLVALKRELSLVQTNIDTRVANLAIIKETIAGANGTELSGLHTQMKTIQAEIDGFETQKTNINSLIATKESQITSKKNEIVSVENQIQGIRDSLSIQANLAPHLVKELDKFIRVETYNDSNFTENNIMELYEEGKKNLAKISQPSIQFDVDVVDFLSIIECQHTWDKLVLGDIVLLENKNIGFSYYVRLVGYEHSPDNNSLNLKFSNTNSFDDATLWIKDLLEQMSNTTSTLDFNKYKWDKTEDMQDRISKMVDEKLEEARQNILNAVGQKHLFDDSGLWLYKENPDGTIDDKQIRAINNTIAFTENGWDTVGTAITGKGIVAENIRGKLGQFAIVNAEQIEVGGGENPPNLNDELARREQETQDKIDLVNGEIQDVDGKISGLEDFTNTAFKDGILDMAEKESLSVHIQQLNNEKADVDAKYTSIYADVNLIGTPKSSLFTTKNNYNTSHGSLITTINNITGDDKITESEKTLINNSFIDYRAKLSALSTAFENAIRAIETKKADTIANDLIVDFNTNTLVPAISGVQTQIDGKIDTWFYAVAPTLSNPPANSWATNAIKDKHIDDLYYDTVKGYAYRFMKSGSVYSWSRIIDSDITKALNDASNAKATADGKMTVYIVQPTTPYHKGDLWRETANATDLKICTTTRLTGSYVAGDWSNATNVGGALSALGGQIGDFSSDLKLTLAEANSLKMSLESVTSESTELVSTATTLGITTERIDYSTSLTTLTNYLNTNWLGKIYPLTITVAQRTNVTNYFKDLEDKKSILLTKIVEEREKRANAYTDGEINTTKASFKVTTDTITSRVEKAEKVTQSIGMNLLKLTTMDWAQYNNQNSIISSDFIDISDIEGSIYVTRPFIEDYPDYSWQLLFSKSNSTEASNWTNHYTSSNAVDLKYYKDNGNTRFKVVIRTDNSSLPITRFDIIKFYNLKIEVGGGSSGLATRVSSAEQKITDTAIVNTVKSLATQGTDALAKKSEITQLDDSLTMKFSKTPLAFRYIKISLNSSVESAYSYWGELQVWANGINIALGKPVTLNFTPYSGQASNYTDGSKSTRITHNVRDGWKAATVDLGSVESHVDSIIEFNNTSNRHYHKKVQVSQDGVNWVDVYNSETQGTFLSNYASGNAYYIGGASSGITRVNQDGIRVTHTGSGGQYSEMRADGFVRKWEFGETSYLNDIWVERFDFRSDVFNKPKFYTLDIPARFRNRDVEVLVIPYEINASYREAEPGFLLASGVTMYSGERRGVYTNVSEPYVEVHAHVSQRNARTDEIYFKGLAFDLVVIGK